jgi:hypothetical protein
VGQYDGERETSALTAYIHKMQLPADSAAAAEVVPESPDVNTNNVVSYTSLFVEDFDKNFAFNTHKLASSNEADCTESRLFF